MIFPILFVLGLAYAGYRTGQALRQAGAKTSVEISGHCREVRERLALGEPVTRWLVNEAVQEAMEVGDLKTVSELLRAFPTKVTPMEIQPEQPDPGPDEEPQPSTVGPSPLEGVADGDWADFVERLRTQPAGYASDRYIGQFEQNRQRLAQLDLPEPTTPEEEYGTMVRDIEARNAESNQLIRDFAGEVVEISGQDHPVTWSGILGIIKCAGPEGAEGWLTDPADRDRFPHTTETFVRTNGCF